MKIRACFKLKYYILQETQKLTVKAVIDPRKNKRITVSEAIDQGILDQGQGQYVNPMSGNAIVRNCTHMVVFLNEPWKGT